MEISKANSTYKSKLTEKKDREESISLLNNDKDQDVQDQLQLYGIEIKRLDNEIKSFEDVLKNQNEKMKLLNKEIYIFTKKVFPKDGSGRINKQMKERSNIRI